MTRRQVFTYQMSGLMIGIAIWVHWAGGIMALLISWAQIYFYLYPDLEKPAK